MKNILITEDCLVGGQHMAAGEVLTNVPQPLASQLLCSGRAEEAPAKAGKVTLRIPDPEPEHRDGIKTERKSKRTK